MPTASAVVEWLTVCVLPRVHRRYLGGAGGGGVGGKCSSNIFIPKSSFFFWLQGWRGAIKTNRNVFKTIILGGLKTGQSGKPAFYRTPNGGIWVLNRHGRVAPLPRAISQFTPMPLYSQFSAFGKTNLPHTCTKWRAGEKPRCGKTRWTDGLLYLNAIHVASTESCILAVQYVSDRPEETFFDKQRFFLQRNTVQILKNSVVSIWTSKSKDCSF